MTVHEKISGKVLGNTQTLDPFHPEKTERRRKRTFLLRPFRRLSKRIGSHLEHWATMTQTFTEAAIDGIIVGGGAGTIGLAGTTIVLGSQAPVTLGLATLIPFGACIGGALLTKCYFNGKKS